MRDLCGTDDVLKLLEWYEAGYEDYAHCSCCFCDLIREENGVKICKDGSCEGCKNLASGKKIRDWKKETMR